LTSLPTLRELRVGAGHAADIEAGLIMRRLVLWDIDRTLLYVGEFDRQVYREVFAELVGRVPEALPAKGTGRTVPLATREMFLINGVVESQVAELTTHALQLLPRRFAAYRDRLGREGSLLAGAVEALRRVRVLPGTVASVVTGNLRASALVKLDAFALTRFLDVEVGGYASDDPHRPSLVALAQQRAGARYGVAFTRGNTVIVGDSREDVATGLEGGARVIGVATGTTSAGELRGCGADVVVDDLRDAEAVVAAVLTLTGGSVG
jgi:phosphoglycolate phosphatase-like HAD superfamily hydrolase